jgi:hypothetical protein
MFPKLLLLFSAFLPFLSLFQWSFFLDLLAAGKQFGWQFTNLILDPAQVTGARSARWIEAKR